MNSILKGVIVDINEDLHPNLVKVRIPIIHGINGNSSSIQDSELPWIRTLVKYDVTDIGLLVLVLSGDDFNEYAVLGSWNKPIPNN